MSQACATGYGQPMDRTQAWIVVVELGVLALAALSRLLGGRG